MGNSGELFKTIDKITKSPLSVDQIAKLLDTSFSLEDNDPHLYRAQPKKLFESVVFDDRPDTKLNYPGGAVFLYLKEEVITPAEVEQKMGKGKYDQTHGGGKKEISYKVPCGDISFEFHAGYQGFQLSSIRIGYLPPK